MILNAVSWYDETAHKVIKKIHKISGDALDKLLTELGCTISDLADYGYYQTDKSNEYIEYERDTNLRDSEHVPLKDDIYTHFLKEVKPHVKEAWIDITSVKIGYEISFNRYFYTPKPLRTLEEVSKDMFELEAQSEGLIKQILGLYNE